MHNDLPGLRNGKRWGVYLIFNNDLYLVCLSNVKNTVALEIPRSKRWIDLRERINIKTCHLNAKKN